MNSNDSEERTESHKALRTLAFGILLGVGSVVVFGVHGKSVSDFFAISSVGILTAGASLLVGGALGFLFGIPKTLQLHQAWLLPVFTPMLTGPVACGRPRLMSV